MNADSLKKYIPYALTAVSCLGVLATGYFASTDAVKAEKKLQIVNPDDKKETAKIIFRTMWPVFVCEALTITACIANQKYMADNADALIGAAAMSSRLVTDYQRVIEDRHGKEELDEIHRQIAKDREMGVVTVATPDIFTECLMTEVCDLGIDGDDLFFDEMSNRWFRASLYSVKNAMYHINRNLALGMRPTTIQMFYEFIGLPSDGHTDEYEKIGWGEDFDCDCMVWIDFALVKSQLEDTGEDYYIITYPYEPTLLHDYEIY